MKPLQAHFLKLTIDRLNTRAMRAEQGGVFLGIAGHIAALLGNEPHTTIEITQLLVLVADVPFVGDHHAPFRQGAEQSLNQGQLIPLGRQQLKGNGNPGRIADQMQLPAEVEFAFTGTIAQILIALNFYDTVGPARACTRARASRQSQTSCRSSSSLPAN